MKVSDILGSKGNVVSTIRPEAAISTVVRRLKLEGIGALVVSEDERKVSGILSERDIVRALVDHGDDLMQMRVSDLMTRTVKTCPPNATVTEVMAEMTRSRIRHLPVVNDEGLCGIISIGDVVKNRLDELQTEANVLRDYIVGRS